MPRLTNLELLKYAINESIKIIEQAKKDCNDINQRSYFNGQLNAYNNVLNICEKLKGRNDERETNTNWK